MWSDIHVELLDVMGSDLDVVNAARVSFAKESDWKDSTPWGVEELHERDEKLIKYLADHSHWSPFSHCFLKFRIKAPIFVARQLQKHTVGLAWNEVSRRYVDYVPEFYRPDTWRERASNKKQGSGSGTIVLEENNLYGGDGVDYDCDIYEFSIRTALDAYNELLRNNVAPEQARIVLPQSTITEWIWSGSLYAFGRVCNLRLSSDAQREAGMVAQCIYGAMAERFPISTSCLVKSGRGS